MRNIHAGIFCLRFIAGVPKLFEEQAALTVMHVGTGRNKQLSLLKTKKWSSPESDVLFRRKWLFRPKN